jgi:hypothetical protein
VAKEFARQQQDFFRRQDLEKEDCNGTQWTRRLIRFARCELHSLWKQCNEEAHGSKSRKQGKDTATERAKTALTALCEKAPCLLEAGRRFFDHQPLTECLEALTRVVRNWATTLKPVAKKGLWRASEHDRLNNRDMWELFEAVPREQVHTPSDNEDEDCCMDDMVETSDDGSSSSEDSSGESNSDRSSNGPPTDKGSEPGRRGFVKLAEQKITEFFQAKPRPKTRTKPKPTANQSQATPTQDH